jgi:hypothetical protein
MNVQHGAARSVRPDGDGARRRDRACTDRLRHRLGYTGGEGLALKLAIRRANLDVDRRQLAIVRGEVADDSPRLTPAAREKQNRELAALDRNSHRKSGGLRT